MKTECSLVVVYNLQFLEGVFLATSDSQMMQITTPFGLCCCLYEISDVSNGSVEPKYKKSMGFPPMLPAFIFQYSQKC